MRESRYLSISVMSVEGGRAVRPRLPLVSVVGPAVAVVVRRHRQQLRAVFRGLRLLRRAVLDLRRQYRQRHAFFRQAENDIEALARFRYQALRMIFDLL